MIIPYKEWRPVVANGVFIAPDAWVIGDVDLAEQVSIFFGSVLRGDILPIRIGRRTNIQEHTIIHTSHHRTPSVIGEETTVGHRATIHGAQIGNRVLIGMGSIILDEAVIEDECVIGAGAIVTEHKRIPSRSLVLGAPGRVVRQLTDEELKFLPISAERYVNVGATYRDMQLSSVGPIC